MTNFDTSTKEGLVAYLNDLNIATLSTVSSNTAAYGSVVYFVVDHTLNFYFLTLSDTNKALNLSTNKNAALTTLDVNEMKTIQTTGTIELVTDLEQRTYMIKEIGEANARKNNPQWPPPISKLHSEEGIVVYKYTPNWLRVGDYSQKKPTDEHKKDDVFTIFIPNRKY